MRFDSSLFWIVVFLTSPGQHSVACLPEPPLLLKNRVWLSAHIFVGVPVQIDLINEQGQMISAQQYSARLQELKGSLKNRRITNLTSEELFPKIYYQYRLNIKRMLYQSGHVAEQPLIFRHSHIFAPAGSGSKTAWAGLNESVLTHASEIFVSSDRGVYGFEREVSMPREDACGITMADGKLQKTAVTPTIHNDGGNYLFYDGHVKWMSPESVVHALCESAKYLQPPFRAGGWHMTFTPNSGQKK